MFERERKKFPAIVGQVSLIAVRGKRPVSWGNYFWLADGPKVPNMWAENLEAARGFLVMGEVEGVLFTEGKNRWFVIDDKNIPDDYYYPQMCWNGGGRPSLECVREMLAVRGDPSNEIEQWTDPASYHAKRGWEYDPKTGVLSRSVTNPVTYARNPWNRRDSQT